MSLFKTRNLWSTQCGDDESFDASCIISSKINESTDSIIIGSHSGFLRVFHPFTDKTGLHNEYNPTDLLMETQLSSPILQVAVGKLVSGSSSPHLCILHPRSMAVYSLTTKVGAAKHGDQSRLMLAYEHQLGRSAYSLTIGSFGGAHGRDFICIQSLDGTLTFFEQETLTFDRFLPAFLLPGPLSFISHTDSFVTVSSSWHVESYKYQALAEAKDSTDQESTSGMNILPSWSFNLGEPAIDLKVIILSAEASFILILGERNLFCLTSTGILRYMKRLEYKPHCFHPYLTEEGRLMTMITTDTSTLLVYELTTLRWSSQLDFMPVAITRGNFDITGVLVLLSESGQLQCCYLGTEPSLFVAPPLESQTMDYKAAAQELAEHQKLIKSYSKTNSIILTDAAANRELKVNVMVNSELEACAFKTLADDDHSIGRLPLPMCKVIVELLPQTPLSKVQVSVIVPFPLAVNQMCHTVTSLCDTSQVMCYAYHIDDSCDVPSLDIRVVTSYMTNTGVPRVIQTVAQLPLSLVAVYANPDKEADFKLTININQPAIGLAQLFPDFVNEGTLSNTSTSTGFCYRRQSECTVSILSAKSSHRYRLQSNNLPSLCLFTDQLVSRLNKYYGSRKDFYCSYTSSLPIHELFSIIEAHFILREKSRLMQKDLEIRSCQFRVIQRRLLTKFKDKTPRPLSNLDSLLQDTHVEILTFARQIEQNQLALTRSGCQLGCIIRLILMLIKLMNFASDQDYLHLSAALFSSIHDTEDQGWEEVTEAAVTHLLRTLFAKNASDQESSKPITLEPISDSSRLKKHISTVIDRLSKTSQVKKLKDSETVLMTNIPSIPEGDDIHEEEEEEMIPVVSQYGERLLSANVGGRNKSSLTVRKKQDVDIGTSRDKFKMKSKDKCRTADDILDMLMSGDVSDIEDLNDELDEEDEEASQIISARAATLTNPPPEEIENVDGVDVDEDIDDDFNEEDVDIADEVPFALMDLTPKKNIQWRRSVLLDSMPRHWEEMPSSIAPTQLGPLLPIEYFERYVPDSLFTLMAEMTSIYALQKGDISFKPTNIEEMKTLVGLHIMMGSLQLPRVRLYWDHSVHMPLFTENMSVNRFFKLRNMLHLVNILDDRQLNNDRMYKVRPIYDVVRKRCLELQLEQNLCVDEQMVPFKGQLNVKQYIKGKPNPWGVKIFMLCGKSGKAYDFVIYQGKTTEIDELLKKAYGQGASVVLHLAQRVPLDALGHVLYCDNYFTSYHLLQILKRRGILAAGTVRLNRFVNPPLKSDKDMKKMPRGTCDEIVSRDGDIVIVKWLDNRTVNIASNFVGVGDVNEARRWDKKEGVYINIPRPEVISLYNENMGGVDLLDMLLGLYRIFIRSKKWTLRMIFHAIDLAITNSWLEYRSEAEEFKVPKKNILDLLHFRQEVAASLILAKKTVNRKRGRPSSSPAPEVIVPKRAGTEVRPTRAVQLDSIDHMPVFSSGKEATRCKKKDCKGRTHFMCEKCKVHLCLTRERNCFKEFHL